MILQYRTYVLSLVKRMNGTVDFKVNDRAHTRMINRERINDYRIFA